MAGDASVSANEASAFSFTFLEKEKKRQQMLLKKNITSALLQQNLGHVTVSRVVIFSPCPGAVVLVAFLANDKGSSYCSFLIQIYPRDG